MRWLVVGVLAVGLGGPAWGAPVTGTARLACGGAVFTARTVYDAHLPPDDALGYLSQSVFVRVGGVLRAVKVDGAPAVRLAGGRMVLGEIVQSWACVRGAGGREYVLLDVACERADLAGACGGEQEWFPLLSVDGVRMDRGFLPGDRRYAGFYARLGVRVDGVGMEDATGG